MVVPLFIGMVLNTFFPNLLRIGGFTQALTGVGYPTVLAMKTVVATVISFVVAYVSVTWLLKFVAHHPITWFVGYRVLLGVVLMVALGTGALSAT